MVPEPQAQGRPLTRNPARDRNDLRKLRFFVG
jgi:hypothetical protein